MLRKLLATWFLVSAVALASCAPHPDETIRLNENLSKGAVWPSKTNGAADWKIGFDPRLEPKDDVRQVASLAAWLHGKTGLTFSVDIPDQNANVVTDVCSGASAFAVVGTVSYLQANSLCGASILVRGRNQDGSDTYRAAIVVAPDSPFQSLRDLRGKSFAFGAINSTQGHLIPRLMLQQAGLSLEDFSGFTYTGSHAETANAVTSRRYDAGALQDTLARDLAQRGLVRILALSDPYPSSGVIAGPRVPQQTVELVRRALLELAPEGTDASALYQWKRSEMPRGFAPAKDNEYTELRQIAETIGLLKP